MSHHAVRMAATMTATMALTSFWESQQDSSFPEETAMGKKGATECFLVLEGNSKKRGPSDEMEEAGAVRVTKRFKRSSSVQLMNVIQGPTTPPAKDSTQALGRNEEQGRSGGVREVHSKVVPSREQLERSTFGLDKLPWELKLRVLQHLPFADLCRVSQVSGI